MSLALIFASLMLFGAVCVVGFWMREFRFTSPMKRLREVEQQMSDLQSLYERLLESHKLLRSRIGMQELRARTANKEPVQGEIAGKGPPPPLGSPKAVLRQYYGLDKTVRSVPNANNSA